MHVWRQTTLSSGNLLTAENNQDYWTTLPLTEISFWPFRRITAKGAILESLQIKFNISQEPAKYKLVILVFFFKKKYLLEEVHPVGQVPGDPYQEEQDGEERNQRHNPVGKGRQRHFRPGSRATFY